MLHSQENGPNLGILRPFFLKSPTKKLKVLFKGLAKNITKCQFCPFLQGIIQKSQTSICDNVLTKINFDIR